MSATPYRKNSMHAVSIPDNDILASDLNEKFLELLRSSNRTNWIVSASPVASFYALNGDNKLILKATTSSPLKVFIGGVFARFDSDIISTATFTQGQIAYLEIDSVNATIALKFAATAPTGNSILVLGTTGSNPIVTEETLLRIPAYAENAMASHKIITDEATLEDPDFIATLRANDVILLV